MNRLLMWKKSKSDIIRTCGKNSVLTLKKPTNKHSMELYNSFFQNPFSRKTDNEKRLGYGLLKAVKKLNFTPARFIDSSLNNQ